MSLFTDPYLTQFLSYKGMRIFLPSLRKWCAEAHPTDIESSTILAQQYPEALPILLTRHNLILNEAITTHNGQVFWISGDAFCAAFQIKGWSRPT